MREGTFTNTRVAVGGGVTAVRMPSIFDYEDSASFTFIDAATGARQVLRAHEVVTQATLDHAEATGAVCNEWAVGRLNVSDGTVGRYDDTGMNVVLEEFFVTNWWEGYIWNGNNPLGRNASFVPSGVSTFPFLCSLPPSAISATMGNKVSVYYDDFYLNKMASSGTLAQWVQFHMVPS